MDEFRKTQTIEVITVATKDETVLGFAQAHKMNKGDVLVQNKGDDSDQWVIPAQVFKDTYEPVKNADYTVLTPEQRDDIRALLVQILQMIITNKGADAQATDFIAIQAETGEKHKSYEDKVTFLRKTLDDLTKA